MEEEEDRTVTLVGHFHAARSLKTSHKHGSRAILPPGIQHKNEKSDAKQGLKRLLLRVLMCSSAKKKEKKRKPSMCPLPNWGFGGTAETRAN